MAEKIRYEKKETRLTEKYQQPPESLIRIFMGIEAWKRLMRFEEMQRAVRCKPRNKVSFGK